MMGVKLLTVPRTTGNPVGVPLCGCRFRSYHAISSDEKEARMVKRYYIRKGDSTTAGGTVTEGSAVMHCDGLPLAFEGDAVSCPACHSTGKILCDGPRWPKAGPDGRQTALSDDLCLCRCNPLPRLIASQSASASAASFFPRLTYGLTYCGGMSLTLWPKALRDRAK